MNHKTTKIIMLLFGFLLIAVSGINMYHYGTYTHTTATITAVDNVREMYGNNRNPLYHDYFEEDVTVTYDDEKTGNLVIKERFKRQLPVVGDNIPILISKSGEVAEETAQHIARLITMMFFGFFFVVFGITSDEEEKETIPVNIKEDCKSGYFRRAFLNTIHEEINELVRTEHKAPNVTLAKSVIERIRAYYRNETPFYDNATLTERNKACMENVYVNIFRMNIVRVAIELYDFLDDYGTTRPMLSESEVIVLNGLFIAYDQACLQESKREKTNEKENSDTV